MDSSFGSIMETSTSNNWIASIAETAISYRRMIDATVDQLSDAELHARPAPEINSVAIILRHLGGNLRSRWTDFLTTDGEKTDRDRESEFQDWEGDRKTLMAHLGAGWDALTAALQLVDDANVNRTIYIRGEPHTIPEALMRSIAHLTYHVGQIAMVARMVHVGEWRWLTIPPGNSSEHNMRTWGKSESRSIFGNDSNAE